MQPIQARQVTGGINGHGMVAPYASVLLATEGGDITVSEADLQRARQAVNALDEETAERKRLAAAQSEAIAALQPDGVVLTPPHSENQQIIRLLAKNNISLGKKEARCSPSGTIK